MQHLRLTSRGDFAFAAGHRRTTISVGIGRTCRAVNREALGFDPLGSRNS
jgi:hypothetical protein